MLLSLTPFLPFALKLPSWVFASSTQMKQRVMTINGTARANPHLSLHRTLVHSDYSFLFDNGSWLNFLDTLLFGLFVPLNSLVHPSQYCWLTLFVPEHVMSQDTILGSWCCCLCSFLSDNIQSHGFKYYCWYSNSQIHLLAQTFPLNSLLNPTAHSTSLLIVFPISGYITSYLGKNLWSYPFLLPGSSPNSIHSKSCKLYFQKCIQNPTISIIIILVCAIIICHLDYWHRFLTGIPASMLVPYTIIPTQQAGDFF